jgi:hypothetical protein
VPTTSSPAFVNPWSNPINTFGIPTPLHCVSRLQLHAYAVLKCSQSLMSEDNAAELGRIQSFYVGSCTARKRAADQTMHAVRNHCWQPLICSPLSAGCLRHCSASSACDDDLPVYGRLSVREHCPWQWFRSGVSKYRFRMQALSIPLRSIS